MRNRTLVVLALAGLMMGCNRSAPTPTPAPVVAAVIEPEKPVVSGPELAPPPRPAARPNKPQNTSPVKAVTDALAPTVPPAPPLPGTTPSPYTSEFDRGELPLPAPMATIPSLPPPATKPVPPSPPPERVPNDLGQSAAENPAKKTTLK